MKSRESAPRVSAWGTCLIAASLLSACATGPAFVAAQAPREGHAVVYVYRQSHLLGAGVKHGVAIDHRPVGTLVNGSHLRSELAVGDQFVDLLAQGCSRLAQPLLLRAGDTAFVQLALTNKTIALGGRYYYDYGCELHRRSASEALPLIAGLPRAD